jgi:hypothetical protein
LIKRLDKEVVVPIVGIEGMRIIAHRTGLFAGADEIDFKYDEVGKLERRRHVYRLSGDKRFPYAASVYWAEYAPLGDDEFYTAMPRVSLGRDAEAAALRKAFPQELGGIYTPEELRRMDSVYQQRTTTDAQAGIVTPVHRSRSKPPRSLSRPPDAPRTYDQFIGELCAIGIVERREAGAADPAFPRAKAGPGRWRWKMPNRTRRRSGR